jgi:hypothetical protein
MKTVTCANCQAQFSYEPVMFDLGGMREIFPRTLCEPCSAAQEAANKIEQERRDKERAEDEWNEVCPPEYRRTNLDDPRLNRSLVKAAIAWRPGSRGLGLIGETGRGKTRCLFVALRTAFDAGGFVEFVSHNSFSRLAATAFGGDGMEKQEAAKRIKKLARVGVLMLDDLGKAPSTERADAELEELIEERTSHGLPILWSANGSGEWLMKRFGPDRGPALVRRLADFCEIVRA